MIETLKKVIEELLSKTDAMRQERDLLISRCQSNCTMCSVCDCPHRVYHKARAPLRLIPGRR